MVISKVLIISLNRFNSFGNKINNLIDYPLTLDLNKYVNSEMKYELYGVCNHIGGMNGGHYYAYCKYKQNNQWYMYNDRNVKPINENEIVNKNAYCLFYNKL